MVSQQVVQNGKQLKELEYVDFPEIKIGKKQTVELVFLAII
jgi:hypothetical protein